MLQFAIGPDGNLYVIDTGQRVSVITPKGRCCASGGRVARSRVSSGSARRTAPSRVGADGQVYVSDSGNDRVEVFTAEGTFVRQFGLHRLWSGSLLPAAARYRRGRRRQRLRGGRLDTTVSAFAPDGSFQWQIGQSDHSPDLNGRQHFADTDSLGRLVLANQDAGRVIYLSASGEEVDAFGSANGFAPTTSPFQARPELPGGACDATVDAADDVVVNSCGRALSKRRCSMRHID